LTNKNQKQNQTKQNKTNKNCPNFRTSIHQIKVDVCILPPIPGSNISFVAGWFVHCLKSSHREISISQAIGWLGFESGK